MDDNDTISEDDWGAAIAEQERAEANAKSANTASSAIFENFSSGSSHPETHNDIDFILDIPVQLTVELRLKIYCN